MTITDTQYDPAVQRRTSKGRGAFNAWFFDTFDRYINFVAGPSKRAAFEGMESGRILEIGSGTGANFTYVPNGSSYIALEPNPAMHQRLRRRAAERGIDLELLTTPGESIPLETNSIDTVLCSLVLCTVHDPDAALSEIRRVLRPGGTFRFVEHIAARPASPRRWLQAAITRPWAWIFEGCQLCRHTGERIESAGFTSVQIRKQRLRLSVFLPVNSSIHGIATK